jgi:DNA polymerase IV
LFITLDHDHFSAQALSAYDPTLRDHPFVVVRQSKDSHKCAVYACSYRAQQLGIRRGQPVQMVLRRHHKVEVVTRDNLIEETARDELGWVSEHYTPEFDVTEYGRCLLNLSGTPAEQDEDIEKIADRIRDDIVTKIGLQDVAIGIASSRLISTMLARLARPADTRFCIPGTEPETLASISADLLPGVSNTAKERIRQYGIKRIGQIQNLGKDALVARLGGEGERLYSLSVGVDAKRRIEKKEPIEAETVLDQDINDEKLLRQHVRYTADKLSHQMITVSAWASRMTFVLTYTDNRRTQKTASFVSPTNNREKLTDTALRLYRDLYQRRVAIKSIRLQVRQPRQDTNQMDLFETANEKRQRTIGHAMTKVRDRLGFDSVLPAANYVPKPETDPAATASSEELIDHLELLDEGYGYER